MKRRKGRFGENGFEDWGGYMNAKKSKLMDQFNEAASSGIKEDDLFKDIAIFVNGYTEPSSDELRMLMMRHGGVYHHYYKSGQTTHVIATNLPDSKFKLMNQLKVVKPNWITDSIKAGRVLNYQDFLLLTHQSKTQPILNFNTKIKNATDDGFIEEFYSNSRLHHISSLGADLKEYILSLRTKKPYIFPGRDRLKEINKFSNISSDIIMHIDMDCFFVSVGIRNRADLKDKPVAVTHAKGNRNKPREGTDVNKEVEAYRQKTGNQKVLHWVNDLSECDSMAEIASCSYVARQAGVKNGMFVGPALKLCPNLQFIQYDFEEYKKVSYILYDTVARYTLDIEAVSCDEMYADCTFLNSLEISPMAFASVIRSEIKEKTGCPCSVGFGRNKLLARLATKKAKPDGQFYLEDDQVESFLFDKPVSDLPGVGRSTSFKFRENGIFTCGDLQNLSLSQLQKDFGQKLGETLYNACRGNVEKGLNYDQIRKSVSADVNYGIRFKDDNDRDIFLKNLSHEVANRLESIGMKGRSITLKVMIRSKDAPEETAKYLGHGVCDTISKGTSLSMPVSNKEIIVKEVLKIMKTIKADSRDLRGIGIQISRLESHKKDGNDILSFFKNNNSIKKKSVKDFNEEKGPLPESPQKLENRPEIINKEETSKLESKSPSKTDGVHSYVSPIEIRLLIKQWVENGKKPKEKDKKMVTEYLQELVNNYRFEDLLILLKSFHRCVLRAEEFSEIWKITFNNILDCVQNSMLTKHKSRLKIDCDF